VGAVGAAPVLGYGILAEYFPKEAAGRANGALNVFHLGGAFVLQYAAGLILGLWTNPHEHYPAIAYQVAFGVNVALQIAALAWFAAPWLGTLRSALWTGYPTAFSRGVTREPATSYDRSIASSRF
jgi:MFS family permease